MRREPGWLGLFILTVAAGVVVTYLVRGIDQLIPQLPAMLDAIAATFNWLAAEAVAVASEMVRFLDQPYAPAFAGLVAMLFLMRIDPSSFPWILSRRILKWAARRAPGRHRDRYEEEWLAEIAALNPDYPLRALLASLGVAATMARRSR
ncbi:MAG TPA: hypothetical protein VFY48_09040 [Solirubrobacterales bacterium]|nr:hypothetical protein [Solirubrobacterales bacterium]